MRHDAIKPETSCLGQFPAPPACPLAVPPRHLLARGSAIAPLPHLPQKAATFSLLSASFRLPQLPPALHPTAFPAFVRIPYHINWDPSPLISRLPSASRPPPPALRLPPSASRPPSAARPPPAPSLPGLTAPYQALFRYTAPLQESQQIGSLTPPAPSPLPSLGTSLGMDPGIL
ncbi:hypothetical protein B0H14DRAFT_3509364 [Mycena olivaceomarginata]|nr:hypothetical protein B0H14DRAFT_3509364 [Mycena olivaceomarginata]